MAENKLQKEKLIREFGLMKEFEKWAGDFYRQVAASPKIEDEGIKKTFEDTAEDENRHVEIIQRLLKIINNNL